MNNLQYGLDVSLKFLHVVHPFNQVSLAIQDKDRRKLFHVIQRCGLESKQTVDHARKSKVN